MEGKGAKFTRVLRYKHTEMQIFNITPYLANSVRVKPLKYSWGEVHVKLIV